MKFVLKLKEQPVEEEKPLEVVISQDVDDEGIIDLEVDGNFVIGLRQDGTLKRYRSIDTDLGLQLDDDGRVKIVDE